MNDIMLNKYAIIQRCLARIQEEYKGNEEKLAADYTRQDSIILNIQRACQAAQDLANYLVKNRKLGIPQESRDSFSLLADQGLITKQISESMMKMVGFRNIAVHEYQKLNINILKAVVENHVQEIEQFAEELIRNTQK